MLALLLHVRDVDSMLEWLIHVKAMPMILFIVTVVETLNTN